jgi:Mn2+/Fe2+ NRAMP family transporter
LQHLAQVAASLQQSPLHAEAADEEEPPLLQHLQPVLSNNPTAQIAPSISIFILFLCFCGWFGLPVATTSTGKSLWR